MTPYDRKMKLQEIKKRLEDGLPCRVVSTSLIEAGVDVDFPVVFREMSGLDSILQAAGRCNREGKGHSRKECIVTVFKIAEEPIPLLFKTAAKVAEQTFAKYENVFTQEAISFYFKKLRHYKGEERQDQKNIMWIIEKEPFSFAKVASRFRLIDNNTATIYIRNEVYGKNENIEKKEIRDKIKKCEEIWKRYNDGERSRALFREMGQFSVSVYEQHMKALYAAGDIEKLDDESYILVNPNLYNQNTGLSLEADFGKALWG